MWEFFGVGTELGMEERDLMVFARNVRAFRALRGWGVRELSERAGVSTKTILKIERGEGCTIRTEQKIALGFGAYVGRLWDPDLLSDERERLIRRDEGRWFFAAVEDAEQHLRRLIQAQPELAETRLRSDPDEIQDEAERHRLGHAGLSRGFVKTMGGGMSAGYFQYNLGEFFSRDVTPPDAFGYTYVCHLLRGGLRMSIRGRVFEMEQGDSVVFQGDDEYWLEPSVPVPVGEKPPMVHFVCLGVLKLPSR
ncbi:MAG: hypothetical protein BGO01_04875 [Armatimonadetes bacterium 55-13]|nr:MAG: hypothetical protein BGO01_04875 [Armatimonadetes bacterium 55-13]